MTLPTDMSLNLFILNFGLPKYFHMVRGKEMKIGLLFNFSLFCLFLRGALGFNVNVEDFYKN